MDQNGLFDVQPLPSYLQSTSGGGDIAIIDTIATDPGQQSIREAGDVPETHAVAPDVGHLDGHNIEVERERDITETIYAYLIQDENATPATTKFLSETQSVVMDTEHEGSINDDISPRRSLSQPEHFQAAAASIAPSHQLYKVHSDINLNTFDSLDPNLCSFFSTEYLSDENLYTDHPVETSKIMPDRYNGGSQSASKSRPSNDEPLPLVISLDKPVFHSPKLNKTLESNHLKAAMNSNSGDSMEDNYYFVDCNGGTPLITPVSSSSESSLERHASISDVIIEENSENQELENKVSENECLGTIYNETQQVKNNAETSSTERDIGNADNRLDEHIIGENDTSEGYNSGQKHETRDLGAIENENEGSEHQPEADCNEVSIKQQIDMAYQKGRQDAFNALQKTLKYNELLVNELLSEKHETDDYVEKREDEAFQVIDKMQREIMLLRKQNTKLLEESKVSCKGKYIKAATNELIKIKYKSDKELAMNIGLRNKINELRLLIIKQQRHLSDLELTNLQLKTSLAETKRGKDGTEESSQELEMNKLSNMSDIIFCDKSKYIPQYPDDPTLASCEVFNIGGEGKKDDMFTIPIRQFNPLDIPYVRRQLSSDFQLDLIWQLQADVDSGSE